MSFRMRLVTRIKESALNIHRFYGYQLYSQEFRGHSREDALISASRTPLDRWDKVGTFQINELIEMDIDLTDSL